MNKLLMVLAFGIALPSWAANVYISHDANGNVVFSDTPSTSAEVHEVRELPSIPAFVPPAVLKQPASSTESAFSYTSLSIVSPSDQYTLATGFAGSLEVTGVLSPGLREDDTLFLLDSGRVVQQGRQSSFQLSNLERGEHKLQIVVRDKKGKTLISSNAVSVFVQRASVLQRAQPQHKPKPAM